jgi:hypothetical protein
MMQNNPNQSTGGVEDRKINNPIVAVKLLKTQMAIGRSRRVSKVKVR